ncbi:hypothetical protein KM043_000283 [Ampulex compressa]|nr:hypothetical protein KM043_000283 [Ampulex compressa]
MLRRRSSRLAAIPLSGPWRTAARTGYVHDRAGTRGLAWFDTADAPGAAILPTDTCFLESGDGATIIHPADFQLRGTWPRHCPRPYPPTNPRFYSSPAECASFRTFIYDYQPRLSIIPTVLCLEYRIPPAAFHRADLPIGRSDHLPKTPPVRASWEHLPHVWPRCNRALVGRAVRSSILCACASKPRIKRTAKNIVSQSVMHCKAFGV